MLSGWSWCFTLLFEDENELVIEFKNTIARIGEAAHDRCTAGRIGRGHLLPDDSPHIVETDGLAELDDFCPDWNNLVPAVIDRTGKLVADVHAETAARMQHPFTFAPDKIQIVDVAFVALMKADLGIGSIIFELPVGR